ncbi:lysylphosphatidylglycerol synthase domain-containing protein [Streptomyces neyagawaensis]|nr:lysylphosphatidylglycerol synthase transmembrane domain-containing protein [Streptomyces neyagawaensis]MCL6731923.1 lysylphosphatidylglycerol synthase domain-containing protein [Streptomyces neyagawaensis]MDE1682583.1 lysylphosphatidylglycerol synthase domain-containing protein [Streptomyces neyagawaensis]
MVTPAARRPSPGPVRAPRASSAPLPGHAPLTEAPAEPFDGHRTGADAAPGRPAPRALPGEGASGAPAAVPAEGDAPAEPPRRGAGKVLRALRAHFGSIAGTIILVVVVWRLGTGVFVDGLRRIDGGTLVAAVGIGVLTTVVSAWRWCAVTRALGLRLPLGPAVADYYRALFLNAALPGGVLGDVHRAVRHGQSSGDMGRGVRAVVIERTAGQLVLAVVGVAALLTMPSPVLEQTRHTAGVLALVTLGATAIWAALRMGRKPRPEAGRGGRVRAALTEARGALLNRDSGPAVLISSVVVLAGYVAMFLLAARVAGTSAGPAALVPLALLALIAMSLPLNVGGWGPREGVTAWSFGAAGLGASQGLTVAVVYGVLSFAAALPGALVLVGRWYGSLRARRQSAAGASEVTTEKYAPKDSTNPSSNSFPFVADANEGRPITPESV